MTRPTVQINQPNERDILMAHLRSHLPLFTTLPGVIGITLNGGLSRGYADHLSEIDITLYLNADAYALWQQGHAPVGLGIQSIDGELYDIKLAIIEDQNVEKWSSDERWDQSYAHVLYDPTGAVGILLERNAQNHPSSESAQNVMFSAWWHFKLAGDIWIYRDDPLQAHFILNQALTEIVKAVFIANSEFVPHEKWLIHMSRTLEWTPNDWLARLVQLMCNLSPDGQSLQLRQQGIAALWDEVDRYLISLTDKHYPLNMMHRYFYNLMMRLVEKSPLTIDEWQQVADLSLLNYAPFNLCVTIDENLIVLDRAKCAALTPEDLYSWHYRIVDAIRAHL